MKAEDMNWYKIANKRKKPEYSWVSVNIPKNISEKMKKFIDKIPERELYLGEGADPDDDSKYGREEEHHVTVKYGLVTDDPKKIEKVVKDLKGGKIKIGLTSIFENDKYDVLKLTIISPALRRINEAVSQVKNEDKHPKYIPHSTLAYLKCGNGVKYKGNAKFKDLEFEFDEIIFEDRKNKKTIIKLA